MKHSLNEKTILFDLDGTLIDHFQAIYRSFLYVSEQLSQPKLDYDLVKRSIGGSLHSSFAELIGKEYADEAIHLFREYYNKIIFEDLYLMPGALSLLNFLKSNGYPIAIFSNKPTFSSKIILKNLNIIHYFDQVIGAVDDVHSNLKKPHKVFTEHALKTVGACPNTAILIGDSHYDIDAAHCVGLPVYIVTSGTHSRKDIQAHSVQPKMIFDDLYDLGHELFGLEKPLQKEPHPELSYINQ